MKVKIILVPVCQCEEMVRNEFGRAVLLRI